MNEFHYLKPNSIQEACAILGEKGKQAMPLAGGIGILPQWRNGKIKPDWLVDLKMLNLDTIRILADGGIGVGALATLQAAMTSAIVRERTPILAETIDDIASIQLRNRATLGGNLCCASPASDLYPVLITLGARLNLTDGQRVRTLQCSDFFLEPGRVDRLPNELLTEIEIPKIPKHGGAVYLKFKRTAMDAALVGVGVLMNLYDPETCESARITLSAVGPGPIQASEASAGLSGKKIDHHAFEKAADSVLRDARPIDDIRASAWYRKNILKTLTIQALQQAHECALHSLNANGR